MHVYPDHRPGNSRLRKVTEAFQNGVRISRPMKTSPYQSSLKWYNIHVPATQFHWIVFFPGFSQVVYTSGRIFSSIHFRPCPWNDGVTLSAQVDPTQLRSRSVCRATLLPSTFVLTIRRMCISVQRLTSGLILRTYAWGSSRKPRSQEE